MSETICPLCIPRGAKCTPQDDIKASLYLRAVLPSLCDLVLLDEHAKNIISDKKIGILFSIRNGEKVLLQIKDGKVSCSYDESDSPNVSLLFWDPTHAVQVFEQNKTPIPLKGFTRLSFLKNEFTLLTKRLEYFLKGNQNYTEEDKKKSVILQFKMAVRSAEVLGEKEEVSRKILQGIPQGVLKIQIEEINFEVYFGFKEGKWRYIESIQGSPLMVSSILSLKDVKTADLLLSNKLDTFAGLGLGVIHIAGIIPIIDNVGLVLSRIPLYIS